LKAQFFDSIKQISNADWQRLNSSACPFLNYQFFNSLEQSLSADAERGWQAHHLVLSDNNESSDFATNTVEAILPMYLKSHSWGEYVFDWDWADAYQQNNLSYYPKLVATLPFTPVTSDKVLSNKFHQGQLFEVLSTHCQQQGINSWHMLFCPKIAEAELPEGVYQRNTVQFQWFNKDYSSFEDYLDTFVARKRKNTKKERLSIT